jgi:hypothetical protein
MFLTRLGQFIIILMVVILAGTYWYLKIHRLHSGTWQGSAENVRVPVSGFDQIAQGLKNKELLTNKPHFAVDDIVELVDPNSGETQSVRVRSLQKYFDSAEALRREGYKSIFPEAQNLAQALTMSSGRKNNSSVWVVKFLPLV